eukprot:766682-Hanusia_phi.AAC.3
MVSQEADKQLKLHENQLVASVREVEEEAEDVGTQTLFPSLLCLLPSSCLPTWSLASLLDYMTFSYTEISLQTARLLGIISKFQLKVQSSRVQNFNE